MKKTLLYGKSEFLALGEPKWGQVGHKAPFWEPKWSQVGHEAPPKSVKIWISDRKGLQDTPKMPPRPLQDASRTDFGWILNDFGMIFD